VGKVSQARVWSLVTLLAGIVCISIMSSIAFVDKIH
jgi:hypothetical protein